MRMLLLLLLGVFFFKRKYKAVLGLVELQEMYEINKTKSFATVFVREACLFFYYFYFLLYRKSEAVPLLVEGTAKVYINTYIALGYSLALR